MGGNGEEGAGLKERYGERMRVADVARVTGRSIGAIRVALSTNQDLAWVRALEEISFFEGGGRYFPTEEVIRLLKEGTLSAPNPRRSGDRKTSGRPHDALPQVSRDRALLSIDEVAALLRLSEPVLRAILSASRIEWASVLVAAEEPGSSVGSYDVKVVAQCEVVRARGLTLEKLTAEYGDQLTAVQVGKLLGVSCGTLRRHVRYARMGEGWAADLVSAEIRSGRGSRQFRCSAVLAVAERLGYEWSSGNQDQDEGRHLPIQEVASLLGLEEGLLKRELRSGHKAWVSVLRSGQVVGGGRRSFPLSTVMAALRAKQAEDEPVISPVLPEAEGEGSGRDQGDCFDDVIAIPRALLRLVKSYPAAALLARLWAGLRQANAPSDRWVERTDPDWSADLGLSTKELGRARSLLQRMGLLEVLRPKRGKAGTQSYKIVWPEVQRRLEEMRRLPAPPQ